MAIISRLYSKEAGEEIVDHLGTDILTLERADGFVWETKDNFLKPVNDALDAGVIQTATKLSTSDVLAGFQVIPDGAHVASELLVKTSLDLKVSRDIDAVEGNIAKFDATGSPIDANVSIFGLVTADDEIIGDPLLRDADTLSGHPSSYFDNAISLINNSVGSVDGIASLDAGGKVPSAQLPSYVDDVLEYGSLALFPVVGETSKIYMTSDTSLTYRWSGTSYVEISASLALGETSATAYRGDRGKLAYDGVNTLKGTVGDVGSVLKEISDNAEDAVFTPTVPSGIVGATLETAVNEVGVLSTGNAVAIATNLENITLKGGYFSPTDVMGYGGRDLKVVFGVATAQDAAAALRACMLAGERWKVRLGDYIDLPEFTIPADSVNPTIYPARTITPNPSYENTRIEIQGFDDCLNVGNAAVPTLHHAVMGFKNIPTTAPFNSTNITTGEYKGSMLFHWLHTAFEPALITALGLDPYPIDRLIDGVSTTGWVGSEKIFLQTNVNIFGTTGHAHTNTGTGTQTQWPLFALNPGRKIKKFNGSRSYWWLAEPAAGSTTYFCLVYTEGFNSLDYANYVRGIVPAFLV